MHRDRPALRRRSGGVGVALAFVVLALAGEWLAHAATWYLTGGATPGQALSGASHRYLGPVGLLLAALAAATSWLVWRGLRRLVDLARSLEPLARHAWRTSPARSGPSPLPDPSGAPAAGFARVWAALVVVQIVVYLVQENVEARTAGFGLPGVRVLTAHHGSTLAIHAAVALLGAALAVEVAERWSRRARAVTVVVARYRALTWRRTTEPSDPSTHQPPAAPPLLLVGRSILSRPPPSLLSI